MFLETCYLDQNGAEIFHCDIFVLTISYSFSFLFLPLSQMPPIVPLSLLDGNDGERKPAACRRRSSGEVLPSDGSAVWAVCEAAGHEWGAGYEDALHQLCATEVPSLLTGAWWQTRRSPQEVISLSSTIKWCKWKPLITLPHQCDHTYNILVPQMIIMWFFFSVF